MPKIRNIIFLLLIAYGFWHFYGDTFNRSGVEGVWDDMKTDVDEIKENPRVAAFLDTMNQEIQLFLGKLNDNFAENKQPTQPAPDHPELSQPSDQSFSVHNIEIGDDRSEVENQAGNHKRSSQNEYGVNWVAYHENYANFFMVAYDEENKVAGLYTNQNLLSSNEEITLESSKETVVSKLGEPIKGIRKGFVHYQVQNNEEYDTFLIDNNYVTIFYDKHENNTVTAIQIISGGLEKQKEGFFAEPSNALREGFEYQLFDLTNAARVAHGLSPLEWKEPVRTTARDHSQDMADNNYFSHTNLDGQTPFDRLSEDDIRYRMAGENLAAGQSSSVFAHEGLMNSLGHRENILKNGYRLLAIGVAFNEESQPYYTENFITE
ncbi:CAP-associated domain-containing protein [Gracilibacillus sp. YIM 98692]|uniref:CAP domain-containing protein n=1 Tax=Gracilibacillus sp. YIM 98692 TaxID=2663532 RepID=UPI0013D6CBF3|nr:CAP-associated domain-containing protein [Gracilibacillus sp. YIM 98692]